jgi:amino-acid N-acetyltransferase
VTSPPALESVSIRRARTGDVRAIRALIDQYADNRILLSKATVTLYEDVQEFWIAEAATAAERMVVGCGALHVMWEDLAEVRTLAVDAAWHGQGIGSLLLSRVLETARELGVSRVFTLTFQTDFFARHGFIPIDGAPVSPSIYEQLLRSYDEGIAEFLELERVKPNTLGNTRMLCYL